MVLRFAQLALAFFAAWASVSAEPAVGPGYCEQKGYELMYRCWVPVEPDTNTFRLYRMEDEELQGAVDLAAEDLGAGPEDEELGLEEEGTEKGRALQDSSLLAKSALTQPGRFEGECKFVAAGRLGAGLRLSGPDSVIISPLSLSRSSLALSGWFRPEKLGGTLLCVPPKEGSRPPLECRLLGDGAVSVLIAGSERGKSEDKFAPGQWRHLAISYTYRVVPPMGRGQWREEATGLLIHLDGKPFFWLPGGGLIKELGNTVLFGNDGNRRSPLVGVVDEIHLAKADRGYYHWDQSLVDRESERQLVDDAPYFRSKSDLLAYAPLDGELAPVVGDLQTSRSFWREPEEPRTATFVEGLRSKGVLAGQVNDIPTYRFTGNGSVREGSVEFWFSPHDWDNLIRYEVQKPAMMIPLLRIACSSPKEEKSLRFLEVDLPLMTEVKKLKAGTNVPLLPGSWYHALVAWSGTSATLYINGEPAPGEFFRLDFSRLVHGLPEDAVLEEIRFGEPGPLKLVGHLRMNMMPRRTVIDEFRVYRRALSRSEILNAYRRYLPGAPIAELPFAEIALNMSYPRKLVSTNVLVLAPEREKVASIGLKVADEHGQVIVDEALPPLTDSAVNARFKERDVGYGRYSATYTFADEDGKTLHTEAVTLDRPKPPWLGCKLGIHEGKVLPGWTPMEYAGGKLKCWGREITIDGRGWPTDIVSQGQSMLATPTRLLLKTDRGDVELKATAPRPELLKQQDDTVITRGRAAAGGWELTTTINAEFDGMMKVEATLTGPEAAEIDGLVIEFPLRFAKDQLYGFWAGGRGFRGSCDYRKLPEGEGVVFRSNQTGRSHEQWQGRVSFIPYLAVCDDWRGFVWFAENDRNWTQSWEKPAQEIVRKDGITSLRLNLISQKKAYTKALTYVFGIQPTPIKPLRKDYRSFTGNLSFGHVDGFNGCWLRSDDGTHMDFTLAPKGLDWSGVAKRNKKRHKLLLYLDRAWQRAPEDAMEFNHLWRGWGDATRYFPEVRDCYIYYMNEWIRRGFIYGVYIDDVWIKPTLSTRGGLAYRRDDGEVEWGVEFFDFRELLKRLRWLFYDNGMEPVIWVHATQTPYIPLLAFVDTMLEGEDRFLPPKHPKNFITCWGLDRIRYSNPAKWGIPSNWMNKIGNEMKVPNTPASWWFLQRRAYQAALALCDIRSVEGGDGSNRFFGPAGCYDDAAEFIGYWDPRNPIKPLAEQCYASLYKFPDRITALLVNSSAEARIANFAIDGEAIRSHLKVQDFTFVDMDLSDPPEDLGALARSVGDDPEKHVMGAAVEERDNQGLEQEDDFEETLQKEKEEEKRKEMEEKGEEVFDDHTLKFEEGKLRLKIRPYDYRLLVIKGAETE